MTSQFSKPDAHLSPETAKLAYDLFLDRLLNFIGAYLLKLRGHADGIVFSGGIGEKSMELRRDVASYFNGCVVDEALNKGVSDEKGDVVEITKNKESLRMFVCFTVSGV